MSTPPLDARGREVAAEGFLVQVWSKEEDRWMDYCRGTWPEARAFMAGQDPAEWRLVDWLLKQPLKRPDQRQITVTIDVADRTYNAVMDEITDTLNMVTWGDDVTYRIEVAP